jgi:hypothetical protein
MIATQTDDVTPATQPQAPKKSPATLYLYLLPFILFPVMLIVAAFYIVPTQWFILHSGNTYMANIGYAATLHNADCQVLVYGDSTAMTGVDPDIIHQQTGLTACNIAEFEGMTAVNQTLLIDQYLSNNPRPRFMVFMFTPEDLRIPPKWNQVSGFEAVTYRLQFYRNFSTLWLVLHHPADTLGWAEQGMRMSLFRFSTKPMAADHLNIREPFHGQLRLNGSPLKACDAAVHDDAPDLQWISMLRTKYGIDGTRVIVDATPAPPCEHSLPFILAHLPGAVDKSALSYLSRRILPAEHPSPFDREGVAARFEHDRRAGAGQPCRAS